MPYELHHGDCLEVLRSLPDCSVDAVVTDPPYGLSFMGKKWDYDVPSEEVWRECLRVLKPGGHLLAFAGTRTQHRMAVRIEDAGFEIRDMIAWVYSQGFPKSLDVSKAIDRAAGAEREKVLVPTKPGNTRGDRGVSYAGESFSGFTDISEPATEAARRWSGWGTALKPALEPITVARKPLIGTVAENVLAWGTGGLNIDGCRITGVTGQRPNDKLPEWEREKNLCNSCASLVASPAKREILGTRACFAGSHAELILNGKGEISPEDINKESIGCSAGLFPGEPKTDQIADSNLNIGESGKAFTEKSQRVAKFTTSMVTDSTTELKTCNACGCLSTDLNTKENTQTSKSGMRNTLDAPESAAPNGRWPSNFIHDGSEEVSRLMTGGEARFFYTAKASKDDRDEGLEGFEEKQASVGDNRLGGDFNERLGKTPGFRRNTHVTVKPTDLMRYLCRLVTPPGGTVLDPFMGSGSTGKAAILEGFSFIGIERESEYVEIARARIDAVSNQPKQQSLFG